MLFAIVCRIGLLQFVFVSVLFCSPSEWCRPASPFLQNLVFKKIMQTRPATTTRPANNCVNLPLEQ